MVIMATIMAIRATIMVIIVFYCGNYAYVLLSLCVVYVILYSSQGEQGLQRRTVALSVGNL